MMGQEPLFLSVVVPIYNEENSLRSLHEQIVRACSEGLDGTPFAFEILFVNDGSTDGTDAVCRSLRPLRYIRLRRNYGQTAALACGFHAARGELIAALDGDGQNDPADIPAMVRYLLDEGLDMVCGWRVSRQDSLSKRVLSRGANRLRQALIGDGVHDSGCTLKVFRGWCLEGVGLYGELHRFLPALAQLQGAAVGEMPVRHRPRTAGKSKYRFSRVFRGFADMLSIRFWKKNGSRPLYGLGVPGLCCAAVGALCLLLTLFLRPARAALWPAGLALLPTGCVVFLLGLLSEPVMRSLYEGDGRAPWAVWEDIDQPAAPPSAEP